MPDLREVFEMVKQQTEPDQDSWAEQERRIRKSQRTRKIVAIAVVAALILVIAVLVASNLDADDLGVAPASNVPSVTVPLSPSELTFLDITTGATAGSGIVPGASEVDVSPDGTKMTYVDQTGAVAVANADGSDPQPFANTIGTEDPTAPRLSPDGTQVVYQREGANNTIGDLFVLDVGSGRLKQITHLPSVRAGLYYMAPTFSSDGRSVIFTMPTEVAGPSGSQLEWDLWTVPATGGDPTQLLRNAAFADVQPNGDSIAFVAVRSNGKEAPQLGDLYVAGSDGSQARKVVVGDILLPRWSPDGSEIAYVDLTHAMKGTYVADVATGDTQQVYDSDEWPEWVDQQTLIIDLSD